MLCESCQVKQATFFYKQTKNGYTVEKNLCSDCAKKMGLGITPQFSNNFGFGDDIFGEFLGGFLEPKPQIVPSETCSVCGMTLSELLHGGRVGCEKCYTVFRKTLLPTISKIHGNVAHNGKAPAQNQTKQESEVFFEKNIDNQTREKTVDEKIEDLKNLLKKAIDNQEYEDAAKYRDEIKAIEKTKNE